MKRLLPILLLFFSAHWAAARAPDPGFQGYTTRLWGSEDGLPDQTIQAFAQSQDGSLWIGTKGGLVRFDGERFIVYNREYAPALLARGINCLFASRDGSLWLGTEGGGLLRYSTGRFQSYPTQNGLTNEFIRAIYQDHRGTVWVGSDQGLFQVTGSSMTRIDDRRGTPSIFVRAITEDGEGRLWVGGTALLEFQNGMFAKQYSLPGGPSHNLITSMFAAHDGTLWIGTLSGLHRFSYSRILPRVPGIAAQVIVIQQSADGALWIGTIGQGLFFYRHGHLAHIASSSLVSRTIEAVLEDRERNLWLGTRAGMVRLSRTPVDIVPFPGGADSEFGTLCRDTDGSIWVAVSARLFRIRDGVAIPWTFPGLADVRVRTLLRDRQGNLWIGTDGSGLIELATGHIRTFTSGNGLINDFVRAILQSRDGSIWVGTDGGLSHIRDGNIENFDTANGLAYFSITSLFEDRNGDLWVGTSRGLSHLSHGVYIHDAATRALSQEELWSICQDADGEIWFGTGRGIYGFKEGRLIHLTAAQGLANNTIYQMLDDGKGNLWISGSNSISRLQLSDLDAFADGDARKVRLTLYLNSRDLASASLYSGMQPEGAVAPNGDVWFPGSNGAIHIAVHRIVPDLISPVVIDEVTADGQQMPLGDKVVLAAGNGRLEISYGAIRLRSQEALRYRYRMGGLEPWTEAFSRRTAYYTHLPPGTYRFLVQTYSIDNPDAVSEASILIVQRAHFYVTPWFLSCCAACLMGAILLVYRFRLGQMRMRFHEVSEERARLAREMHDTVIQGCVGVSSLLEAALGVEAAEEPLRQQLLNYATDQVRATIEAAREAVWALRNTSASAADAGVFCRDLARQFQSDSGIPIGFRVTGAPFMLGESATRELMMTVREALTNAVSHAKPKSIDMCVCFADHDLMIDVNDDGHGFDVNAALARNGHYGILGMQERARLLGGDLKIESVPGQGTKVRIAIPRRRRAMERTVTANAS